MNRDFVLGEAEREQFVKLLRLCEQFCGVRVVTHCVMSNHFHILVEVPTRPESLPTDEELLSRPFRAWLVFHPVSQGVALGWDDSHRRCSQTRALKVHDRL